MRAFLSLSLLFLSGFGVWYAYDRLAVESPSPVDHVLARQWIAELADDPERLTELGLIKGNWEDDRTGQLSDRSVERALAQREAVKANLAELKQMNRAGLAPRDRLSLEAAIWDYEAALKIARTAYALTIAGRQIYAVDQLDGIHILLPNFMITQHDIDSRIAAERYVQRLRMFGRIFQQVIGRIEYQERAGIAPPKFILDKILKDIRSFTEPPVEENVLYAHLSDRIDALGQLSSVDERSLLSNAQKAVGEVVYPAFQRLGAALERTYEIARDEAGVWQHPGGVRLYTDLLRWHTTTELSADEIHDLGVREVARIEAALMEIFERLEYGTGDAGERLAQLSADPDYQFEDTQEGREALLEYTRQIVRDMEAQLPTVFSLLPKQKVDIRRIPQFAEAANTTAYYLPGNLDGSRVGTYYLNLRSTADLPKWVLKTLSYHEAVPGHHLQIALTSQLEGARGMRRTNRYTSYVEGWGLYAESLAGEMGVYKDDPFGEIGRLQYEMLRAVRLVVDTGMHHKRWPREQALAYMRRKSGMPPNEVEVEIDRYVVWPGQATAYKIGQLKLLELREQLSRDLGSRYTLKDFHKHVLTAGPLPFDLLEKAVTDAANGVAGTTVAAR